MILFLILWAVRSRDYFLYFIMDMGIPNVSQPYVVQHNWFVAFGIVNGTVLLLELPGKCIVGI